MNHTYRTVWNATKGVWQAVGEHARRQARSPSAGRGKQPTRSLSLGGLLLVTLPAFASDLPTGGRIMDGNGGFDHQGNRLTIHQDSQNLAINWDDFSIAEGHSVHFQQPNAESAALNRVTGNHVSDIRGALSANGRVFLVNPNGIHFSRTAQVDVGALVASTLDITTDDFMTGNYRFEGDSGNAVINAGRITSAAGGAVAMIAAEIIHTGRITTPNGSTLMGAGNKVTLDLGGPVKIEVDEARLETHIEQGGAIRADGGLVYLTARAANELTRSVINHTGITEARTLASNDRGEIMLMGDMASGRVQVAGTLDASAPVDLSPDAGDGGFIETSAAQVQVADGTTVTTRADSGDTGTWLIDPKDFTIAASSGDMTGQAVSDALATTDFEIETATMGTDGGNGDLFVNDALTWNSGNTLTLDAERHIEINAAITADQGTLVLDAVQDISANAAVKVNTFDLTSGHWAQIGSGAALPTFNVNDFRLKEDSASFLRVLDGDGSGTSPYQIADVYGLQGMESRSLLGNHFVLANDIDASGTVNWEAGAGFDPIGSATQRFNGSLNGQGHFISDLTINRGGENDVGLFGVFDTSAELSQIGLADVDIEGNNNVGGLAGGGIGNVSQAWISGTVRGVAGVGGLIGLNGAWISQSQAAVGVEAGSDAGGLAGINFGWIERSMATGDVSLTGPIAEVAGGLVGRNETEVDNSAAFGSVTGNADVGGLVGINASSASFSYSRWNQEANPTLNAAGSDTSDSVMALGLNTADFKLLSTYSDINWGKISMPRAVLIASGASMKAIPPRFCAPS